MFRQQQLFKTLSDEKTRVSDLIKKMEQKKHQLPGGSLIYRNGSYYRSVYHEGKHRQFIIPAGLPDEHLLIGQLQERQYIKKALPVLKHNLACYKTMLNQMQIYDPVSLKGEMPSCYNDLDLGDFFLEGDFDPEKWEQEPYEKNMGFADGLKYKSENGLPTRSKAEAEIAMKLEQHGLCFRYDSILHLGKHTVSPDFEILHPIDRNLMYWEHFGKMDSPEYAHKSMVKIQLYAEHGIYCGHNLIITWESKDHPLTFQEINNRINRYLLTPGQRVM